MQSEVVPIYSGVVLKIKWNNVSENTSPEFGTWPLLHYMTTIILLIIIIITISHNYVFAIEGQDKSTIYDWLCLGKKSVQSPGKIVWEKCNLQLYYYYINPKAFYLFLSLCNSQPF